MSAFNSTGQVLAGESDNEIRTKAVIFYEEGIRNAKEIGETYNISDRTVRR
jgi:hypothetical protein